MVVCAMSVDPNPKKGYCACGRKLHYGSKKVQKQVQDLIDKTDEYIRVTAVDGSGTWLVQRHYIALHGLKIRDLPNLGFHKLIEK